MSLCLFGLRLQSRKVPFVRGLTPKSRQKEKVGPRKSLWVASNWPPRAFAFLHEMHLPTFCLRISMHRMHFHAFGDPTPLTSPIPASGVQKPAYLVGDGPARSAICEPHGVLPQVAFAQQCRRIGVQALDPLPDDVFLVLHPYVAYATWHGGCSHGALWRAAKLKLHFSERSEAGKCNACMELRSNHGQPKQHAENAPKCKRCMEVRLKHGYS